MNLESMNMVSTTIGKSFIRSSTLMSHHIGSYEYYTKFSIPKMIRQCNPIRVISKDHQHVHTIHLMNTRYSGPTKRLPNGYLTPLTPVVAMSERKTYQTDVIVDCMHRIYKFCPTTQAFQIQKCTQYLNVHFFSIPTMVNSTMCHHRHKLHQTRTYGTFIINGYQKCLIAQETLKINFPYVTENRHRSGSKYMYRCQVRSAHADKMRSTSTLNIYITNVYSSIPHIMVHIPFLSCEIPLTIIFRLLGVDDCQHIIDLIMGSNKLDHAFCRLVHHTIHRMMLHTDLTNMDMTTLCKTIGQRGCAEVNAKKRVSYFQHLLAHEFLPHCGIGNNQQKLFYFSFVVRKLLRVFQNKIPADSSNSYRNKRVQPTGILLGLLTRQLLVKHLKTVNVQLFKLVNITTATSCPQPIFLPDVINGNKITNGIRYAMSTGNWGIQKTMGTQTGVCQVVNSMNILSTLSHLRQVNTPLNRDGKMPDRRQLDLSHLGILCCAETPEGKSVGFLSNLAMLAQIRNHNSSTYVRHVVIHMPHVHILADNTIPYESHVIFVNGKPCAYVENQHLQTFIQTYKTYRRSFNVPINSNICYHDMTSHITIDSDGNDCIRPVLCMKHFHHIQNILRQYLTTLHLLWTQLFIHGILEYVNKQEETSIVIAVDLPTYLQAPTEYTHMEIDAAFTLFGTSAGCIPFSNKNQAPRNIYQSSMCKQATTGLPYNFHEHFANKKCVLNYPQQPLVQTTTSQLVGDARQPSGQAVVTAVQILTGYNQEDAILVNEASLQRGLFSTTIYETFRSIEKNHGSDKERITKIADLSTVIHPKPGSYTHIGDDGIAKIGSTVTCRDVLIQKHIDYSQVSKTDHAYNTSRHLKDKSTVFKRKEPSIVQQVQVSQTKDGLKSVAVRTSTLRTPEIGDKLSSRHGQKGIIGMTIPEVDMPFTQDGTKVDIIINCHSFPSRMTIGHLAETLLGKAAALDGRVMDGTPFRGKTMDEVQDILHKNGFSKFGKEVMYSGTTGKRLTNPVFLGITYYQRLRHMVQDKIHARATGPRQNLIRQPREGRSRNGGLRVGEMERDSLISHGCSSILMDRLCHHSDVFETVVCKTCGFIADKASKKKQIDILHRRPYCFFCKSHDNIVHVKLPYAMKVLWQELMACHIHLKFGFK